MIRGGVFTTPSARARYGKVYKGNERPTFIVDPDGKVAGVLRKVKPAEHDALVLEALEQV
jgi:peroxiredoxin Q/BCP